jgi:hypothetical protein
MQIMLTRNGTEKELQRLEDIFFTVKGVTLWQYNK